MTLCEKHQAQVEIQRAHTNRRERMSALATDALVALTHLAREFRATYDIPRADQFDLMALAARKESDRLAANNLAARKLYFQMLDGYVEGCPDCTRTDSPGQGS